ncbi:DUF6457 domain-containing protein [Streptomyces sp. N2-109]|uniref:DUF6457 domain-containing protein n=1 Tax=Streptomyces gossypii TaxID=2883101 RepID=A0ABT2JMF6_9ACTN|nr:DUF6457 domain-containing protein [Streptomyces gossypii]MCT2589067.1 DUF6457 domain-containing protein [Streptomyces gossypii]
MTPYPADHPHDATPPDPGPHGGAPYDAAAPYGAAPPYDAVVVAGGGARRLGGADKPALTVGARSLLDRTLAACADATATVVVGPRRATYRPVTWVREDPPGGGPLAALDAGLRKTARETVLVLSADLPFLRPATVRELLDVKSADGTVVNDGRDQPLVAAYRAESLRRELALLRTEYGTLANLPLGLLLPGLELRRITSPDALDCDTWDDLATARARIREHGNVLDEWTAAVKTELGIDLDVDTALLLDLARDAAHGVARPAAPLTTFLVGYAAAQRGGSVQDVAEIARRAAELANRWAAEAEPGTPGDAQSGPGTA